MAHGAGKCMTSVNQSSPNSSPLSYTQIARFHELQERHQKLSASIRSGVAAPVTGTGSVHPAGDTWMNGLKPLNGSRGGEDDLLERLARLATTEPPAGRPPLETYTTTPTAHGDVFRATPEFRAWLRSRYRGYGVGDHGAVEVVGPPPKALGGTTDSIAF